MRPPGNGSAGTGAARQNATMNIAIALRNEIVRLARKELRTENQALKRAAATHRREIAALKRRAHALEQQLRRLDRAQPAAAAAPPEDPQDAAARLRFSPAGLAALRKRLQLSAHDLGLLAGVSGQSIYNWERGQTRPRTAQLAAVAGLRSIGKKEAAARLQALRDGT